MTQILTPLLPQAPNAQGGGTAEGEPLESDDTALAFAVVLAATPTAPKPPIVLPKGQETIDADDTVQAAGSDLLPDEELLPFNDADEAILRVPEASKSIAPEDPIALLDRPVDTEVAKTVPVVAESKTAFAADAAKLPTPIAYQNAPPIRPAEHFGATPQQPREQIAAQPDLKQPAVPVLQQGVAPEARMVPFEPGKVGTPVPTQTFTANASPQPVIPPKTPVPNQSKQDAQMTSVSMPLSIKPSEVTAAVNPPTDMPIDAKQIPVARDQSRPQPAMPQTTATSDQPVKPAVAAKAETQTVQASSPSIAQSPPPPPIAPAQKSLSDVTHPVAPSPLSTLPDERRREPSDKIQATVHTTTPKQGHAAAVLPDISTPVVTASAPFVPQNTRPDRIEPFDPEMFAIASDRAGPQHVASPTGAPQVAMPEQARQIAQQMAMATPTTAPGTTEITLNPEELGRVKMSLSLTDGAMVLTITAERPDTIDIMRRHIDLLAQTYRQLGFANMTFNFAGSSEQGQSTNPTHTEDTVADSPAAKTDDSPQPTPTLQSTGRMDLRL